MLLDPDMMKYKLTVPSGVTYYFAEAEHMTKALIEGGGTQFMKMSCYAINKQGKFIKNRSVGVEFPNLLLEMGRDKVNEFFNFMEDV